MSVLGQRTNTGVVYSIGRTSVEQRLGGRGTFKGLPHTPTSVNQTRTRPGMLYGHRNIAMLYGGPCLNLIYISALPHRGSTGRRRGMERGEGRTLSIRILSVRSEVLQVAPLEIPDISSGRMLETSTLVSSADIYNPAPSRLPIFFIDRFPEISRIEKIIRNFLITFNVLNFSIEGGREKRPFERSLPIPTTFSFLGYTR